jgi:hypothetical protein
VRKNFQNLLKQEKIGKSVEKGIERFQIVKAI